MVILYGPGECPASHFASVSDRGVRRYSGPPIVTGATSPSSSASSASRCQRGRAEDSSAGTGPPTVSTTEAMKSSRRISPSVNTCIPASCCNLSAAAAAASSSSPRRSGGIVPRLTSARAVSSSAGRSMLPTCSARMVVVAMRLPSVRCPMCARRRLPTVAATVRYGTVRSRGKGPAAGGHQPRSSARGPDTPRRKTRTASTTDAWTSASVSLSGASVSSLIWASPSMAW